MPRLCQANKTTRVGKVTWAMWGRVSRHGILLPAELGQDTYIVNNSAPRFLEGLERRYGMMEHQQEQGSPEKSLRVVRIGALQESFNSSINQMVREMFETRTEHVQGAPHKRPDTEDLRRMHKIKKRATSARMDGTFALWNVDTDLCDLCSFLVYLVVSSFSQHDPDQKMWPPTDTEFLLDCSSGKIFWHHSLAHFSNLAGNACELCALLAEALWDKLDQPLDSIWDDRAPLEIEICTWYPHILSPTFIVGFSHTSSTDRVQFCFSDEPRGSSLSEKSIQRVSELLWTCMSTHQICSRNDSPLPTRAIDVGSNTEDVGPRLVITEGQTGSYIALSHCWGNGVNHVLTEERMKVYECGIGPDQLTTTFSHAIHIARKLGIRWLWIDALCIIQDCNGDWKREALRMAKVYENAAMVLSAASGPNSSSGMEFKRSVQVLKTAIRTPRHSIGRFVQQTFNLLVNRKEPIDSRAWTLQEHMMATAVFRVSRELHAWRCREKEWREEETMLRTPTPVHMTTVSKFKDDQDFISRWQKVVMEYSRRKLKFPEDRLPALSGIASTFEARAALSGFKSRTYLVGMWRESLVRDLLWASSAPQVVETERAPSWSWIVMDQSVEYCGTQIYASSCCEIVHDQTYVDDGSKAARRVKGTLVIKGFAGRIGQNLRDEDSVGEAIARQLGLYSALPLAVWLDRIPRAPIWYLKLAQGDHSTEPTPVHWLMLLEENHMDEKSTEGTFRRVGLCKAKVDTISGKEEVITVV